MGVGKRIREKRIQSSLSQTELADKVGISKQTLYKYENEIITNIPSDKIEKIAGILHTSPEELMGWQTMHVSNSEIDYIIDIYEGLDPDKQSALLSYAKFLNNKED